MATLSELVKVIAEVEGVDPATVAWVGRSLREGGLIAKRGRGPSAAHMGWTDAANLLIGVNATRNAADAAKVTIAYRRFRSNARGRWLELSLSEAIEQLLGAAATGKLTQPFLGVTDDFELTQIFATERAHVELRFRTNAPFVLLRIAPRIVKAAPELTAAIQAAAVLHFSPRRARDPPEAPREPSGDCVEEKTIGFRTLSAVGKLIHSHAP